MECIKETANIRILIIGIMILTGGKSWSQQLSAPQVINNVNSTNHENVKGEPRKISGKDTVHLESKSLRVVVAKCILWNCS